MMAIRADHHDETPAMKSSATQRGALSIGQLARRWGLGPDRIRRLIESGSLPGAFKIPSAGKYGAAIRIPRSTVVQAEQKWTLPEHRQTSTDRLPSRRASLRPLTHLPELNHERGAGYREDDQS